MEVTIRDRIFHSAQKLFVEKGYHNTSVPDIVKDAGVSIGAVYHHYKGKEDLARCIHLHAVDEFLHRFDQLVSCKTTIKDKVFAYVDMMFVWAEEDPIMVAYLLYARPSEIFEKCMTVCSEEGLAVVKEIIEEGMITGQLRSMDQLVAAATISGILIRMIEMRRDGMLEASLTSMSEEVAETIWIAIRK